MLITIATAIVVEEVVEETRYDLMSLLSMKEVATTWTTIRRRLWFPTANHITQEVVIQATEEAQDTWAEELIVVHTVALIVDVGHQEEEEEVDLTIILETSRITTLQTLNLNAMNKIERKTQMNGK